MKDNHDKSSHQIGWHAGQHVSRRDSDELGAVVEVDKLGTIKVKWEDGKTSYYHLDRPGNVRPLLQSKPESETRGKRAKWTEDDDQRLLEAKANGNSNRGIGRSLNRSASAVEQRVYILRDRGTGLK
jgi:hypothetical protein